MEQQPNINQNIMPEIRLFPVLDRVAGFIGRVVSLGHVTEECLTEHKRGAADMLDTQLYEQPELDFGYDDMGNYLTNKAGEA